MSRVLPDVPLGSLFSPPKNIYIAPGCECISAQWPDMDHHPIQVKSSQAALLSFQPHIAYNYKVQKQEVQITQGRTHGTKKNELNIEYIYITAWQYELWKNAVAAVKLVQISRVYCCLYPWPLHPPLPWPENKTLYWGWINKKKT